AGVDARLIIAPHEPTAGHIAPIRDWANRSHLPVATTSDDDLSSADIIIVDRVGALGDLYCLADIAYVGGGFHNAGLHSVLEPAPFGAPVIFGPRNEMSRDAVLLAQRGGGVSVTSEPELARRLRLWLTESSAHREASDYARALVRSGVGAAERSFALVA